MASLRGRTSAMFCTASSHLRMRKAWWPGHVGWRKNPLTMLRHCASHLVAASLAHLVPCAALRRVRPVHRRKRDAVASDRQGAFAACTRESCCSLRELFPLLALPGPPSTSSSGHKDLQTSKTLPFCHCVALPPPPSSTLCAHAFSIPPGQLPRTRDAFAPGNLGNLFVAF